MKKSDVSACVTCGTGITQQPGPGRAMRYCLGCRPSRHKLPTSMRGYGPAHQRLRTEWKLRVDAGQETCCLCALPIGPTEPWHLDHTPDRTAYRGVAHQRCNLQEGQRRSAMTVLAKHYGVDRDELAAWLEDQRPDSLSA